MMQLKNKIVGVTGAGTGIGRAICMVLAAEAASVAVTDINQEWAASVANDICSTGQDAVAFQLDVTDRSQIENVIAGIVSQWGRIDIWCNNAGVSSMKRFEDLTEKDWNYNMDVNAKAVFLCSQVVVRQMLKQTPDPRSGLRGKIINTASMAGKRGNAPFLAHYVASKFAVVGLTQAMAGELAAEGITVNAICPGYVRTSMQQREADWEASLRGSTADEVRKLYINDTPLRRLETPEDVAGSVLFLASPGSDFITGEAINVNGGSFME
jgi:NAD(P)-dependent dehydrogenase (short-subunit alcohol dehydrogenase family)